MINSLGWGCRGDEAVARVAAARRVRAEARAVLLAAVGEVEARGLAKTRGAPSTNWWLTGQVQKRGAITRLSVAAAG